MTLRGFLKETDAYRLRRTGRRAMAVLLTGLLLACTSCSGNGGSESGDPAGQRESTPAESEKNGTNDQMNQSGTTQPELASALPADYTVKADLCNPNASEETKALYSYLREIYGTYILSGQYSSGSFGTEINAIRMATGGIADGKYPAVLGLDLIEYSPSRVERGSSSKAVENAIEWWENGGIVTFCWHWNAPSPYLTGEWYSGFYTDSTNINLKAIMNGEDPEGYRLLNEDIDAIAAELTILRDAGVPVLWRPLHEASGGWFWWGASGPEAYKELYILLYDRLTNEYGLNNLIWVWNGQSSAWYPGDEYADMAGTDIYTAEHNYGSQKKKFEELHKWCPDKMLILSENGVIPDPALCRKEGAMWGLWCTWNGEFTIVSEGVNRLSDKYTESERLKEFYAEPCVLTRDELPEIKDWKAGDPVIRTAEPSGGDEEGGSGT